MIQQITKPRPLTGDGESELVIRSLYENAGEYDKGLEHQIQRILELGLKRFDLDIGILSNINDSVYTVFKQVSTADVPLGDGDIDDFKTVNDTYGHSVGDSVLVAIAGAISSSVRPNNICGRIGGSEFMVLLPLCTPATASKVSERMRAAVSALHLAVDNAQFRPSVSIGAGPVPGDTKSVTKALAAVGFALQKAKTSGKNAVTICNAG